VQSGYLGSRPVNPLTVSDSQIRIANQQIVKSDAIGGSHAASVASAVVPAAISIISLVSSTIFKNP
jgi:hypothetical protein